MKNKKAFITGITGQDGSYLAEILLEKGYEVHGLIRRSSINNKKNIQHILDKITLHKGDMLDQVSLAQIIRKVMPDELYHEADQDHVDWSFEEPYYNYMLTGAATGGLLEIVKNVKPETKVFIPVTIKIFGDNPPPQNENTPLDPQSPYACAKTMAYFLARYYRQTYKVPVSTGILCSHDSTRRGEDYLLQKICKQVKYKGEVSFSNLDYIVDISYARDVMEAAHAMLQQEPDDFVIGSAREESIGDYVRYAFEVVGKEVKVNSNDDFKRPGNLVPIIADITKISKFWQPKTSTKELISLIMDSV